MKAQDMRNPNTYEMKHSVLLYIVLCVTSILIFIVAITYFVMSLTAPAFVITSIFFFLSISMIFFTIRMSYSITYDDRMVGIKGFLRRERSIQWNEIKGINGHPRSIGFDLMDSHENKLIRIDGNLDHLLHFIETLFIKCPYLFRAPLDQPMKGNPIYYFAYLGGSILLSLFVIGIMYPESSPAVWMISGGITLFGILFYLFAIRKITLKKDRLLLQALARTINIPIQDIKAVQLERVNMGHYMRRHKVLGTGQWIYYITLVPKKGRERNIKLPGMNNVILFLYLRNWFEENRQGSYSQPDQ